MRNVSLLLAITLIASWMTQACLAEEAARDGSGSTVTANPDVSHPPAGGDAAAAKPSASGGRDSDGIDTRITAQPRRLGRRDEVGHTKPLAPPVFRPRRWSAHEGSGLVTRDAIGLPVAPHDGLEEVGPRHDVPALGHNPAGAPTAFGANASGGLARTGGTVGHPPLNANRITRPAALNRGTINGTTIVRPGFGPSSIGGPAKSAAEISGTTIRPKH